MHHRSLIALFGSGALSINSSAAVHAQEHPEQRIVEALQPEHFAILPWDQTRLLSGPEDRVHGLASLAECNFTLAGFPRVADLPACEKLGLKAIVMPSKSLA